MNAPYDKPAPMSHFQCPYCAQFAQDVFPSIDSAYVRTGLVQWVYVNLPLPAQQARLRKLLPPAGKLDSATIVAFPARNARNP